MDQLISYGKCLLVLAVVLLCTSLTAQDPAFSSQFWADRVYINPAYVGIESNLTASMLTRQQWTSLNGRNQTNFASVDAPYQYSKNANIGLGLRMVDHRSGEAGYGKFDFAPVASAHIGGRDFTLGIGLQYSLSQVRIDWSKLVFSDQLNAYEGLVSQTTAANIGNDASNIIQDLSSGILFRYKLGGTYEERGFFSLGASVFHLNRPRETLIGIDRQMDRRYTIHGLAHFVISDFRKPPSKAVYMSVGYVYNTQSVLSTNTLHMRRNFGEYLFLGLAWRSENYPFFDNARESVLFNMMIIPTSDLRIVYSYDIVVSELGAQTTSGSQEVGIVYRFSDVFFSSNKLKRSRRRDGDCWYYQPNGNSRIPSNVRDMLVY